MGRGTRSPKRNDSRVMIRNLGHQSALSEQARCWEFPIIGASDVQVPEGSPVTGLIIGKRVAVSTRSETLGFAPNNIAAQLIESVRATGKRLRGRVLSSGSGAAPMVELC